MHVKSKVDLSIQLTRRFISKKWQFFMGDGPSFLQVAESQKSKCNTVDFRPKRDAFLLLPLFLTLTIYRLYFDHSIDMASLRI